MANANVNFQGQKDGAGLTDATFLQVYGGEIFATFQTASKFLDKHKVIKLTSGKSATFPVVGQNSASYHTPGSEILGVNVKQSERVISLDDLLISSNFTSIIDDLKNHYDFRSQMTVEAAYALANQYDKNVAQVAVNAARSAATLTGGNGGTQLTNAAFATDATVLAAGLFDAAQALDEKNVPDEDRYVFLRPAEYYNLAQNKDIINKWYGGSGAISDGTILKVAGITVVKTNNLPKTAVVSGPANYQGDFTNTVGLVMQKGAVGTVSAMDIATEMEYDIRRQGHLLVAKYAMGHGILRPECAVELKLA